MAEKGSPRASALASATAVVGVLAAVGLMLLLVTWAATIGPQQVMRDEGNPPTYPSLTPSASSSANPRDRTRKRPERPERRALPGRRRRGLVAGGRGDPGGAATAIRWLLTRDWRRKQRDPDPHEVAFDPLDAPALLAEKLAAGARGQREALATGSPRNAIVACWGTFEELAEDAGVYRQSWETSSEFTMRVLDTLSADGAAVLRLAVLYRDARHSEHDITEANRRGATEALDAIHRSLGARTSAGLPSSGNGAFWRRWLAGTALLFGAFWGRRPCSTPTRDPRDRPSGSHRDGGSCSDHRRTGERRPRLERLLHPVVHAHGPGRPAGHVHPLSLGTRSPRADAASATASPTADRRLRQRHDLGLRDPAPQPALLGDEAHKILTGPPGACPETTLRAVSDRSRSCDRHDH